MTTLILGLLVACATDPARGEAPKPAAKATAFLGKVVPVSSLKVKPVGKFVPDAVALVGDDGKTYPIEASEAAKMLVLDPQLHNRPMKLTATLTAATQSLKVEKVQSVVKGVVHDIDYWCDNCQFPNTAPGPCMCCGGPTEFRERPAKEK